MKDVVLKRNIHDSSGGRLAEHRSNNESKS